ncbi:P-loop containing nucleoside triphosphate hydrolase protein [Xylaria arbuscula]|nr:P-loop containing nucleoside triphosphate hydrolase protein [Xylaria arbuscula]
MESPALKRQKLDETSSVSADRRSSSRCLSFTSLDSSQDAAASSSGIGAQILLLIQSPALTQTEIVEIEVIILQQHLSRLKHETHTEKARENIQKAINLILELREDQNSVDSNDRMNVPAQFKDGELIKNRSPSPSAVNPSIVSDDLSDVSDSFLAELAALVDTDLISAEPKRVERDSDLQPLSLTRTRPTPNLSDPGLIDHPWSSEVQQVLRDRFQMSGFRCNQLEAINATLAGEDAFVLMATGGGKSLCYQLPAVVQSGKTRGITLVVCPLLSLMYDQVEHLRALNISAVALNSEGTMEDRSRIMEILRLNSPEQYIDLLYVTPEMITQSEAFLSCLGILYRNKKLARFVIDEAHCVSQWGHDFRPDYKELGRFRRNFPDVPLMALTATATENVITDMKHNLAINTCQSFSQSFNRPNLYYAVLRKEKYNVETIAELINTRYSGMTGIIYALSRSSTETIATKLQEYGILSCHYHASIAAHEKVRIQQAWQRGDIKVVVATIAFGMGIDKPDVRFVIHQSLPKSLEGYYQETGRAGRDGKPSECYLYFSYSDFYTLRKLINDGDGSLQQRARQGNLLEKVIAFCNNQTDCRRVEILRYFGESFPKAKCNASCDNCEASTILPMVDFTQYAIAALKLMQHHGKLTPTQCVNILMGRRTKFDQKGPKMYHGIAKHIAKHDIHRILSRLTADDALKEENIIYRSSGIATQYLRVRLYSYFRMSLLTSHIAWPSSSFVPLRRAQPHASYNKQGRERPEYPVNIREASWQDNGSADGTES